MIDVTSTSFGLIMAYILPGLTFLYSLSFFSSTIHNAFATILSGESNFSPLLLILLVSLCIGLILTVFRWIVFDQFFCDKIKLNRSDFSAIGHNKDKLVAFKACTDEYYRYNQFWGGMFFSFPVLIIGVLYKYNATLSNETICLVIVLSIGFEIVLAVAAIGAYEQYIAMAHSIIGDKNAQRMANNKSENN